MPSRICLRGHKFIYLLFQAAGTVETPGSPAPTLTIGGGAALVEVGLPDRKILAGGLATHGGRYLVELLAVRGVLVVHGVFPFVGVKKT